MKENAFVVVAVGFLRELHFLGDVIAPHGYILNAVDCFDGVRMSRDRLSEVALHAIELDTSGPKSNELGIFSRLHFRPLWRQWQFFTREHEKHELLSDSCQSSLSLRHIVGSHSFVRRGRTQRMQRIVRCALVVVIGRREKQRRAETKVDDKDDDAREREREMRASMQLFLLAKVLSFLFRSDLSL